MRPDLYGLILTGGKSARMGRDKAEIAYGDLPQWRWLATMLEIFCVRVFWSCTVEQKEKWNLGDRGIVDILSENGPAGGLLAAHQLHPETAWLVLACDYPYLQREDLQALVEGRALAATAFRNPEDGFAEPLLAIWEPAALKKLVGNSSPREVLRRCEITLLSPRSSDALINMNTPSV